MGRIIETETLVSGAGLSGMSCAINLMRQGRDVFVIDKATFPRFKLCGGMLTGKSYREYSTLVGSDLALKEAIVDETSIIVIYCGYSLIAESKPLDVPLRIVDRMPFDNGLLNCYKKLDGKLSESTQITKLGSNSALLDNGDTIHFQKLVVAEGVLSPTRKNIGLGLATIGFCLETLVDIKHMKIQFANKKAYILFNIIKGGYGWIFPYGDKMRIGFGNYYSSSLDYKKEFARFIKKISNANVDELDIKGAFIPVGSYIDNPSDNIFFVGDAGGYIDPTTFEGIYFALKTGSLAAEAISGNLEAYEGFDKIKKIMCNGMQKQKKLYNPILSKVFFTAFRGKTGFVKYYAENMLHEYNFEYDNLGKLVEMYKSS